MLKRGSKSGGHVKDVRNKQHNAMQHIFNHDEIYTDVETFHIRSQCKQNNSNWKVGISLSHIYPVLPANPSHENSLRDVVVGSDDCDHHIQPDLRSTLVSPKPLSFQLRLSTWWRQRTRLTSKFYLTSKIGWDSLFWEAPVVASTVWVR